MSHTLEVKSAEVKDMAVLANVCNRLGYTLTMGQGARLYGGAQSGLASVAIPGWHYPVVVDESGNLKYDNYGGNWGAQEKVNALIHEYSVEATLQSLSLQGMSGFRQEVAQQGGGFQTVIMLND